MDFPTSWSDLFGLNGPTSPNIDFQFVETHPVEAHPIEAHPVEAQSKDELDDVSLIELVEKCVQANPKLYVEDYFCLFCGKQFKNVSLLEKHENFRCKNNTSLKKCKWCMKRYKQLHLHKNRCKRNPAKYQCKCGKKYTTFRRLSKHVKKQNCQTIYSMLKYPCDLCDERFATSKGMLTHKGRMHK